MKTDPFASLADLYAAIIPGQTIAEATVVSHPGTPDEDTVATSFAILAKERSHAGEVSERIRCYSVSYMQGCCDIGDVRATPVDRLLGPDGSLLWERK